MTNDRTMLGSLALLGARWQKASQVSPARGREDDLQQFAYNTPSARVPLETGLEIWRSLPVSPERGPIALEIARRAPLSALQLLESASSSAPHLLGAIEVFCRYSAYLWTLEPLSEQIAGGEVTITWDDAGGVVPTSLRDFTFARIAGLVESLGVQPVRPEFVTLPEPAPSITVRQRYEQAFGCPLHFQQSPSAIVLRTSALSVPLYGSNPVLHTSVTQRLGAFRDSDLSTAARVVGTLEQLLDEGDARIGTVAARLGMSGRSLQKALNSEGYRFCELLQRVRRRRAMRLLCETETPIASVASALGYGNVGSFSRAFVHWLGCSPASFRLRHRGA